MATFNAADTVELSLESIAAQTYENWEFVICDDGSSDDTFDILERWAQRQPGKVTLLRNEVNSKLPFSLNRCLDHATGELIARMDADDVSVPARLATQVQYLLDHPEVDLVGTAMQRFDDSGHRDVVTKEAVPDRFAMRRGMPFSHATIMTRAKVYASLGGYTVSKRTERGQDYDLWFRFFARGFVGHNLAAPLYEVREDINAIKRRKLIVRLRAYRTTIIGYRLLGYPLHWYVRPTVSLLKGLVPTRAMLAHRNLQHRRYLKSSGERTSGE